MAWTAIARSSYRRERLRYARHAADEEWVRIACNCRLAGDFAGPTVRRRLRAGTARKTQRR